MLWKEWMWAGLFSQSCVCRLLIYNTGKSLGTGLFFFVLNLRLSCFTFLFCHLFSVSWFAFHSASVHCIPGWFSFSCKLLQMHSPGLWLGCEMGSPALAPRFPCCILTPPCAVNHRESWKTIFSFFLRKKRGCLCWSFNFVSNQWAGPAHCAAACLLGPAGVALGKAELDCPSSSSQPLKKFGTGRCSPMSGGQSQRPCLIRTASTRKPGFGELRLPVFASVLSAVAYSRSTLWLWWNIYWTFLLD